MRARPIIGKQPQFSAGNDARARRYCAPLQAWSRHRRSVIAAGLVVYGAAGGRRCGRRPYDVRVMRVMVSVFCGGEGRDHQCNAERQRAQSRHDSIFHCFPLDVCRGASLRRCKAPLTSPPSPRLRLNSEAISKPRCDAVKTSCEEINKLKNIRRRYVKADYEYAH